MRLADQQQSKWRARRARRRELNDRRVRAVRKEKRRIERARNRGIPGA